jgi:hypothetical protein
MTDWPPDQDPLLRGWDDRHAILTRPRRAWGWLGVVSLVGALAIALGAVEVYQGHMPAWVGGLLVVGVGVAWRVVEVGT